MFPAASVTLVTVAEVSPQPTEMTFLFPLAWADWKLPVIVETLLLDPEPVSAWTAHPPSEVMTAFPAETQVPSPPDWLIVATGVLPESQLASPVKSLVVLSAKVPVAVNCWVQGRAVEGVAGVMAMDESVTGLAEPVPVRETA